MPGMTGRELKQHLIRGTLTLAPRMGRWYRRCGQQVWAMVAAGMTYRQIGSALGIHWTRVGQIANS